MTLYRRLLGSAFENLPAPLQQFHNVIDTHQWSGVAQVRRGSTVLSRVVGRIFGFPEAAREIAVRVVVSPHGDGELWIRNFGGRKLSSTQRCGSGKTDRLLIERFGIIDIALALVVEGDRLYLVPGKWSCAGIPLPRLLLPGGETYETERDGKFCFHVEVRAPLIGLIVAYEGELLPV